MEFATTAAIGFIADRPRQRRAPDIETGPGFATSLRLVAAFPSGDPHYVNSRQLRL
jgi:hypothetical protein